MVPSRRALRGRVVPAGSAPRHVPARRRRQVQLGDRQAGPEADLRGMPPGARQKHRLGVSHQVASSTPMAGFSAYMCLLQHSTPAASTARACGAQVLQASGAGHCAAAFKLPPPRAGRPCLESRHAAGSMGWPACMRASLTAWQILRPGQPGHRQAEARLPRAPHDGRVALDAGAAPRHAVRAAHRALAVHRGGGPLRRHRRPHQGHPSRLLAGAQSS